MMKRSLPLNSLSASFVAKIPAYASPRRAANQHRPHGRPRKTAYLVGPQPSPERKREFASASLLDLEKSSIVPQCGTRKVATYEAERARASRALF